VRQIFGVPILAGLAEGVIQTGPAWTNSLSAMLLWLFIQVKSNGPASETGVSHQWHRFAYTDCSLVLFVVDFRVRYLLFIYIADGTLFSMMNNFRMNTFSQKTSDNFKRSNINR
jgi:hypothetical protein